MPFLGRDWRSPGDQWVRTSDGWEKLRLWRVKVFENLNENVVSRLLRLALADATPKELFERRQSYIPYNKGTTRERKELTSLSEAMIRLDMAGAVKDLSRFNYVCTLVQLILQSNLTSLSGTAQKHIFLILEAMCKQVLKTEYNIGLMRDLLQCAEKGLQESSHAHIGSKCLWSQHQEKVKEMIEKLEAFELKERENDGKKTLNDLPEDCIRCILRRMSDHKDILRTSQTNTTMYSLSHEDVLWKQLCFFHFSDKQLLTFLPLSMDVREVDWKFIYKRCYKRYGKKDTFADMLALCSNCCNIFWQSLGHPCVSKEDPQSSVLTPEAFIKLF